MKKHIYSFEEGSKDLKEKLGGKGASLAEMTNLGLPVPEGITIISDVCNLYYENDEELPEFLKDGIKEYLTEMEEKTGKEFGNPSNPLLLSVRSGAASSMPGMMDTILNLGLNDEVVEGLAETVGSESFAYDSYRRLIRMFGEVVYKIEGKLFEEVIGDEKDRVDVVKDSELGAESFKKIVKEYKEIIKEKTNLNFPQNPVEQLITAVEAVFGSWNNERAIAYRESQGLDQNLGTAVNIQMMVFGNLGSQSGTGVLFTRNPSNGEKELYGEYLLNAQGEDVVGGGRTPNDIAELEQDMPKVFYELQKVARKLENHYQDMQDIEFTIEEGELYLLQTRTGKRTARADIKIAVDMVEEGLINQEDAVLRIDPEQLENILHPQLDPESDPEVIATGLAASPGAAVGKLAFDADEAKQRAEEGEEVILVRPETTPDDIEGVLESEGVLTIRGGMTSHAAVVARGVAKPCVSGCEGIDLDVAEKKLEVAGEVFSVDDYITIDGTSGRVLKGKVNMIEPELGSAVDKLLSWADNYKTMGVMSNVDNAEDGEKALELGAEGVGLCRTEHMFRMEERIEFVRNMILSDDPQKERALNKIENMQKKDFEELFLALDGAPIIIRLLDAPLHEFLPDIEQLKMEIEELNKAGKEEAAAEKEARLNKVKKYMESNPMLGFRGCRLGIRREDIYKMQVEAILEAVYNVLDKGVDVEFKIMVPLVSHVNEFKVVQKQIEEVEEGIDREDKIDFEIGTMIELPRTCAGADKIADEVDFFSFGTNDLTQTTFGFSRDDVENRFLKHYLEADILPHNPFVKLDEDGVGRLIQFATRVGKKKNSSLKVGICGEQAGNPQSISFCQESKLDYISCSPYRVPIARLSAAQAALKEE